jgi:hypothetical protein
MTLGSLGLSIGFLVSPAIAALPQAAESGSTAPVGGWIEAQQTIYHVTERGAHSVETRTQLPAPPAGPAVGLSTMPLPAGQLWSRVDPLYWVGKVVSIGNNSSQVFTEFDSGVDHAEFLSAFDTSPATPVWQTPGGADLSQAQCDSAEYAPVHVTMHQVVTNNDQIHRQPVVCKYSSSSSTPDWFWVFPSLVGGPSRVAISRDGQKIVAVVQNNFTNKLEIAVFSPGSGTPLSYTQLPNFTQLRGFDLSSDGSTLYVSSATSAYLFNVAANAVSYQIGLPTALDCHAISGDGSVFAFGTFGTIEIFERNGSGGYTHTYTRSVPGPCVCGRIDISDDSSTMVYGFNFYDTNLHVRVEALDLPTKTVTMSDDPTGAGAYQNVLGDISVSADGSRFAAGLWGDEAGVCPELRCYTKYSSAPAALYDLPGSVFDVDISADGTRVAAASKTVHANVYASGGAIGLYAFSRGDLRAFGVPTRGATITFAMHGPQNSPAVLLWTDQPAAHETAFPNVGTLYLRRTALNVQPATPTDPTGDAVALFTLPGQASDVGRTFYFQGFFSTPRRLTAEWAAMTILP